VINSDEDRRSLQAALDGLVNWSVTWGMRFNIKKCKVMHLGRRNNNYDYEMAGQKLDKTREEKDLGVIISDNLKPAAQCAKAAKTAQTVLGSVVDPNSFFSDSDSDPQIIFFGFGFGFLD
jgi:hypothetical protein